MSNPKNTPDDDVEATIAALKGDVDRFAVRNPAGAILHSGFAKKTNAKRRETCSPRLTKIGNIL
jgi:hypothetical protein